MENKVHENKNLAKAACDQYIKEIYELQDKFGVWEENDDSCSETFIYARYYNESGEVVEGRFN